MRLLMTAIFCIHTALPALADENYVCFLDKFMEVANDGRFFGPEATEIKMQISVKEKRVFYNMGDFQSVLGLIEKLGTLNLPPREAALMRWRPYTYGNG